MALFGRRGRDTEPPPAVPVPLPVPPFPPDPPSAEEPTPWTGDDPRSVLHGHDITLPSEPQPLQAAAERTVWSCELGPAVDGVALWERVRAVHPATGLWPVLATSRTVDSFAVEAFGEEPPPVRRIDAAAWLSGKAVDGEYGASTELLRSPPAPWEAPDPAEWVDRLEAMVDDIDRLLLVPAAAGWAVPGLLGWTGATNYDVLGDEHTAVLRRWSGLFGAELVTLGFDVLTLRIVDPPRTPEQALTAAVEMAVYCPDIVHQGVQTVDALVPMAASSVWWFWWD